MPEGASVPGGLTAVGLMIPVLNRWLTESVEPAADCADALIDALTAADYRVVRHPDHSPPCCIARPTQKAEGSAS
jgi:hypothetical protein